MTLTFESVQKLLKLVIYHIVISDLVWSLKRVMSIEYILKNMRNINVALKALAVSMCVCVCMCVHMYMCVRGNQIVAGNQQ